MGEKGIRSRLGGVDVCFYIITFCRCFDVFVVRAFKSRSEKVVSVIRLGD